MTHLNDITKIYLDQIAEKKDDSYLEPDMKKRQANNEKARKELAKGPQMKNPHFESVEVEEEKKPLPKTKMFRKAGNLGRDAISTSIDPEKRQKAYDRSKKIIKTLNVEGLDPVGKEDADVDNDGKKNTKADKYLMNRRKAIGNAMKEAVHASKTQIHSPHEVPDKNLKGLVKKAVKRIDTDVDGDTDHNDKAKGELGEFIPGVGNKRLYSTTRTKTAKESFSNWRQDLSEVMGEGETEKKIKEKKVNNKIKINPKLGEAIEQIGGTLLEEIEVDEMDFIIESVYDELLEEGYAEDDVEEAIENAMEATVTFGSDTKPMKKDGSQVGSRRKFLKRKAGEFLQKSKKKVGMAVAQARVDAYNKKREVKQAAKDKVNQKKQGLKNFIKNKAQKVVDRMSEEVEVEEYVDFLITEGYDCSDLTWDDMYEEYQSLDEGLRSAVKRLLGKKKEEPAKPMSRGDQLRKKYNVGPEKSDTSAKAQILKKTRAKADSDQKEFGGSRYSKGVADKSKAAHERQLKGGYSKYGADDARGKGNKARKRAAALTKEELEQKAAEMKEDASMSPQELQLQKRKAMVDRMIAQKRQQSLNKTKKTEPPAKAMGEATEDSLRDRRMERGGVGGNIRYDKAPKPANTAGKKKPYDGMSALEKVKASIRAKHGQGAIMDTKKK